LQPSLCRSVVRKDNARVEDLKSRFNQIAPSESRFSPQTDKVGFGGRPRVGVLMAEFNFQPPKHYCRQHVHALLQADTMKHREKTAHHFPASTGAIDADTLAETARTRGTWARTVSSIAGRVECSTGAAASEWKAESRLLYAGSSARPPAPDSTDARIVLGLGQKVWS